MHVNKYIQYIMSYTIESGRLVNLAIFNMKYDLEGTIYTDKWVSEVDASEVLHLFRGWEKDVEELLSVNAFVWKCCFSELTFP
jgi:phenolic acid decarboxylase